MALRPVDPDYPDERRRAIFEDSERSPSCYAGLEDKVPVTLPTVVVGDTMYDAAVTPLTPHTAMCVRALHERHDGRPKGSVCPT